jgi:hypothetical protein
MKMFMKWNSLAPTAAILCLCGALTAGQQGQQPGSPGGKGDKKEWKKNARGGAEGGKQGMKHDGPKSAGMPIFEQAKALNLSSEQQQKLTALQESLRGEMESLKQEMKAKRGEGAPGSPEERKEMMKAFQPKLQDLGKRAREGVFAIVTPEQKTELQGKLKGRGGAKGPEHANRAPQAQVPPVPTTSNVSPVTPPQTSGTAVANPFAS